MLYLFKWIGEGMIYRTEMAKLKILRAGCEEWMEDARVASVLFSVFTDYLFMINED